MSTETKETTMFAYRSTLNRLEQYANARYEYQPPYDRIINDLLDEVITDE